MKIHIQSRRIALFGEAVPHDQFMQLLQGGYVFKAWVIDLDKYELAIDMGYIKEE